MLSKKVPTSKDKYFLQLKKQIKRYVKMRSKNTAYKINAKQVEICIDRISSFLLADYILKYSKRSRKSRIQVWIKNSRCEVDISRQILKISMQNYCIELLKLLKLLFLFEFNLILPSRNARTDHYFLVYSLTKDQIENRHIKENYDFLSSLLDCEENQLLIQAKSGFKLRNEHLQKSVLIYLSRIFVKRNRFSFFYHSLIIFLKIVKSITINKFLIVGSSNYFELELLKVITRLKKINFTLVSTQSQITSLPPIFYLGGTTNSLMLWYSDNSIPELYEDDLKKYEYDLSYLTNKYIQQHLVLTKQFSEILRSYNAYSIVKTITPFSFFYHYPLNKNIKKSRNNRVFQIAYFPVTPRITTPEQHLYSTKGMQQDIKCLVSEIQKFGVYCTTKLFVKPKRTFTSADSNSYTALLKNFESSGDLTILEPRIDLIELIKGMDLVICTPFTTVALISNYLGIPTCYFMDRENDTLINRNKNIQYLSGSKSLSKFLRKALAEKVKSNIYSAHH